MAGRGARNALLQRMRAVVDAHAQRIAVHTPKESLSYLDFSRLVGRLMGALRNPKHTSSGPVGLLLDRSAMAYAAMWAAIALGRPYVPLNAKYPARRLRSILRQASIDAVVCTQANRDIAIGIGIAPGNLVVAETDLPDKEPDKELHGGGTDWNEGDEEQGIAYILFTSGSTGEPKGVPISYDNLGSFINNLESIIRYRPEDVCSQFCDLSFDMSVHEIYLALLNGCALCPARPIDLFNPARLVAESSITVWVSVPSLARVALRDGPVARESLGTLRLTVLSGEALTGQLAKDWSAAAPGTEIWNTYAPSECTTYVTAQRWRDHPGLMEAGVVALGTPFPDCTVALLVDEEIVPVTSERVDVVGELLLATPQCFAGYLDWRLPSPFIEDSAGLRFYRTGDRVRWNGDRLYYLNRLDFQVKIGGHRIELQEVEHRLREGLGTDELAVVAHPPRHPTELVLFLVGDRGQPKLRGQELGLPGYMVPRRTVLIDALPVTARGKLNRNALHERIATNA